MSRVLHGPLNDTWRLPQAEYRLCIRLMIGKAQTGNIRNVIPVTFENFYFFILFIFSYFFDYSSHQFRVLRASGRRAYLSLFLSLSLARTREQNEEKNSANF